MAVSSCMLLCIIAAAASVDETADEIAFSRIEANLKMIDFLKEKKTGRHSISGEASILVYGDSKWFQENNYEEICSLLRTFLTQSHKRILSHRMEILERFHIITKEQEILLKVLEDRWKDFCSGYKSASRRHCNFFGGYPFDQTYRVGTEKVMTIENKTSFQRMIDKECSYLYLGRYANRQSDHLF